MAKNELRRKYLRKQIVFKYYIHDLYLPPKSSSYRSLGIFLWNFKPTLALNYLNLWNTNTIYNPETNRHSNQQMFGSSIHSSVRPSARLFKKELS